MVILPLINSRLIVHKKRRSSVTDKRANIIIELLNIIIKNQHGGNERIKKHFSDKEKHSSEVRKKISSSL